MKNDNLIHVYNDAVRVENAIVPLRIQNAIFEAAAKQAQLNLVRANKGQATAKSKMFKLRERLANTWAELRVQFQNIVNSLFSPQWAYASAIALVTVVAWPVVQNTQQAEKVVVQSQNSGTVSVETQTETAVPQGSVINNSSVRSAGSVFTGTVKAQKKANVVADKVTKKAVTSGTYDVADKRETSKDAVEQTSVNKPMAFPSGLSAAGKSVEVVSKLEDKAVERPIYSLTANATMLGAATTIATNASPPRLATEANRFDGIEAKKRQSAKVIANEAAAPAPAKLAAPAAPAMVAAPAAEKMPAAPTHLGFPVVGAKPVLVLPPTGSSKQSVAAFMKNINAKYIESKLETIVIAQARSHAQIDTYELQNGTRVMCRYESATNAETNILKNCSY